MGMEIDTVIIGVEPKVIGLGHGVKRGGKK